MPGSESRYECAKVLSSLIQTVPSITSNLNSNPLLLFLRHPLSFSTFYDLCLSILVQSTFWHHYFQPPKFFTSKQLQTLFWVLEKRETTYIHRSWDRSWGEKKNTPLVLPSSVGPSACSHVPPQVTLPAIYLTLSGSCLLHFCTLRTFILLVFQVHDLCCHERTIFLWWWTWNTIMEELERTGWIFPLGDKQSNSILHRDGIIW